MMRRRAILAALPLLALTACPSNSPLTPQGIVNDAAGIVAGLAAALPKIAAVPAIAVNPKAQALIAQAEEYIGQAQAVLASLSSNMPANAGAGTLATLEGYVNAALAAVGSITGIPAQLQSTIDAAAALLPIIEAFINTALGTQLRAAASRRTRMSPAQARKVLGIQ